MQLLVRRGILLMALYAVGTIGLGLWLTVERNRSAARMTEETLAVFARENAALLDEAIREESSSTDLLAPARLALKLKSLVGSSDYVASIAVVDTSGLVLASDQLEAGTQLAPLRKVFPGSSMPEVHPGPQAAGGRDGQESLFVPLWRDRRLTGYMQISFRAAPVRATMRTVGGQLSVEIFMGLLVIGVIIAVLHRQITGQVHRLARTLESLSGGDPVPIPSRQDEFAPVYAAAEKLRASLDDARATGTAAGQRFGTLADVLSEGLLWFSSDRRLDFANRRALDMFGAQSVEELRGRWSSLAPAMVEAMRTLEGDPPSSGATMQVAIERPARRLRVRLYRFEMQAQAAYVALVSDLELLEAVEDDVQLAGQMQSINRIYRTVVHELRSPLGAIIVNIDLLRDTMAGLQASDPAVHELQRRYLGIVQAELTRLNHSLLEMLTRVTPQVQDRELIDLRLLINDLGTLIAEQARRQGVTLQVDLPEESPVVLGHSDRLKQAFLNIVVNALEAMPGGGRLRIEVESREGRARVRFQDTGPGLPEGLLESIYEMGCSTKSEGTGTGLFVARALVEQHSGAIRARSSGEGTCFEVDLPLAAPRASVAAVVE